MLFRLCWKASIAGWNRSRLNTRRDCTVSLYGDDVNLLLGIALALSLIRQRLNTFRLKNVLKQTVNRTVKRKFINRDNLYSGRQIEPIRIDTDGIHVRAKALERHGFNRNFYIVGKQLANRLQYSSVRLLIELFGKTAWLALIRPSQSAKVAESSDECNCSTYNSDSTL